MARLLTFQEVMAWYRRKGAAPMTDDDPAGVVAATGVEAGGPAAETQTEAEEVATSTATGERADQGTGPRDGYSVEARKGGWHALIGPDGEQVGSSQRSEAEAWALLEG